MYCSISSIEASESLIRKYEPVLYFHPDEQYFPMDVDAFITQCDLWNDDWIDELEVEEGEVSLTNLENRDNDYYLEFAEGRRLINVEPPLAERQFWNDEAYQEYTATAGIRKLTYYAHQMTDPTYGYIVIQYWFFYAFNSWGAYEDGYNVHEGDWEMITLFLNPDTMIPDFTAYSYHHSVQTTPWALVEKDGDHPVVYVARGSHASYFHPGDYPQVLGLAGIDYAVKNDDKKIGPNEWENRIIINLSHPDFNWLRTYEGKYGSNVFADIANGESGPVGPPHQGDKWYHPAIWANIPLSFEYITEHFKIKYTIGGPDSVYFSDEYGWKEVDEELIPQYVYELGEALETAYFNYRSYGFHDPLSFLEINVEVKNITDRSGCPLGQVTFDAMDIDNTMGIELESNIENPDLFIQKKLYTTAAHELFHKFQIAEHAALPLPYTPYKDFISEGTAVWAEDLIFDDINLYTRAFGAEPTCKCIGDSTCPLQFFNNTDRVGFEELSYAAALFWKYFAEQYSFQKTGLLEHKEKESEIIDKFLEHIPFWNEGSIEHIDDILQEYFGKNFEQFFLNWIVANYTKGLDNIPKQYTYSEAEIYDSLIPEGEINNLTLGQVQVWSNKQVHSWSADYYRITPEQSVSQILTAFDGESTSDFNEIQILVLGEDSFLNIGIEQPISIELSGSNNMSYTVPCQGAKEVIIIVSGAGNGGEYHISVTGRGSVLSCSSNALDFGAVYINTSDSKNFTITNVGDEDILISPQITSDSPNFVVSEIRNPEISPGNYSPVTVIFTPTEVKQYSNTLTVNSHAGDPLAFINLSGKGITDVEILPLELPTATKNQEYGNFGKLQAVYGKPPYTWTISGNLPYGLEFDSGLSPEFDSGVISGIPKEIGDFPITITVKDYDEIEASKNYTLTVSDSPAGVPRFLTLPLKTNARVVNGWYYSHPPNSIGVLHAGIDYEADLNQSVVAAADGMAMVSSQYANGYGYGRFVFIKHYETDINGNHYFTLYAHLNLAASHIKAYPSGQRWNTNYPQWTSVKRGEVVGYAGEEDTSWVHLHFEVNRGGYALNKTDAYDLYKQTTVDYNSADFYPPEGSQYSGSGSDYLWTTDPPSLSGTIANRLENTKEIALI